VAPTSVVGLIVKIIGGIQNDVVTKKIELPRNWDKLAAKYKDVVPAYVPY
jgi:hypothetical protein